MFHCAAIALVWSASQFMLLQPRPLERPVFHKSDVIYYSAAEYLPPLNTGVSPARAAQKGEPEHALQQIISVPADPDNRTQTVVTPPNVKLNHEVPLPNVVAWAQTELPGVPMAATARPASELRLPAVPSAIVAPAPEVQKVEAQNAPRLPQAIVPPPPGVEMASDRQPVRAPQPAVIAPPPEVDSAIRRVGQITIAPTQVVPPAPKLPLAAQRSFVGGGQGKIGSLPQAVVPPPPAAAAAGPVRAGGRLIALNLHPVPPSGPVEPPAGNRRGRFAATPEGKPGAAGTPDSITNGPAQGYSEGHGKGGAGGRETNGIPSGLMIGAPPAQAKTSVIAGQGGGNGIGSNSYSQPAESSRLMARATIPATNTRPPATELSEANASELDKRVFHDRKFYSMTLNLPNLNSAGGSWVIHFAELKGNTAGVLIAPVPTRAVDPAYPAELMRENVEGKVTLYAVIHSDGSVGDIKVLEGSDDRLNEYAQAALARWHFQPASRNGSAVALEAVVTIPFRARRRAF